MTALTIHPAGPAPASAACFAPTAANFAASLGASLANSFAANFAPNLANFGPFNIIFSTISPAIAPTMISVPIVLAIAIFMSVELGFLPSLRSQQPVSELSINFSPQPVLGAGFIAHLRFASSIFFISASSSFLTSFGEVIPAFSSLSAFSVTESDTSFLISFSDFCVSVTRSARSLSDDTKLVTTGRTARPFIKR